MIKNQNIVYRFSICCFCILLSVLVMAQDKYFQQEVNYTMDVKLVDSLDLLKNQMTIEYVNNSPDVLDELYLNVFTNAFENNSTPLADQLLQLRDKKFYFAKDDQRGFYSELNFKVDGSEAEWEYLLPNKEFVRIRLKRPLNTGERIIIQCMSESQIPDLFVRSGKNNDEYHMTFWYPKMAVYDKDGWHTLNYLAMGEVYSDYGNYDVTIESPNQYQIFATGAKMEESKLMSPQQKLRFVAKNVIDFAWFALLDRKTVIQETSIQGRDVRLEIALPKENNDIWEDAISSLESAVQDLSKIIGPYPYDQLTVIGIEEESGMEYPQIVTAGNKKTTRGTDYIIAHEVGHQWFYGILGFNERAHPWLDEGLTTYYEHRLTKEKYGNDYYSSTLPNFMNGDGPFLRLICDDQICQYKNQSLSTNVEEISALNYGINSYERGANAFAHLEGYLGRAVFDKAMTRFFETWKFKHPRPSDLRKILEETSKKDLSWFFDDFIHTTATPDYSFGEVKELEDKIQLEIKHQGPYKTPMSVSAYKDGHVVKTTWLEVNENSVSFEKADYDKFVLDHMVISPDSKRSNNYKQNNSFLGLRQLEFRPIIGLDKAEKKDIFYNLFTGYNTSDGFYIGPSLNNSFTPFSRFKYYVGGGYSLKTKEPVGNIRLNYDHPYYSGLISKWELKLGLKSFHFEDNELFGYQRRYIKIDPSFIIHFRHSPKGKTQSKIGFRNIILYNQIANFISGSEGAIFDGLQFGRGENPPISENIYELSYQMKNTSVLNPFQINIALEQQSYDAFDSESYLKLSMTYDGSFAFSENFDLGIRIFGGKFLTNTQRNSTSYSNAFTRGSFSLMHQGFNDYRYDAYFLNRANQNASFSNQITMADGGFKTPLGSQYSSIGASNDMMVSVNLTSAFVTKLPKILPLRLFADFGYFTQYSNTEDAMTGTFMYDGGVYLDYKLVQIYLPILVSSDIQGNYDSEDISLFKRISFRFDLQQYDVWDLADDFPY